MAEKHFFVVVDSCARSRAKLTRLFYAAGHTAQPCESIEEINTAWLDQAIFLIADDNGRFDKFLAFADSLHVWPKTIVYSQSMDQKAMLHALRNGAVGYLRTPIKLVDVLELISSDVFDGTPISRIKQRAAIAEKALQNLTEREREILSHISRGETSKEIGACLKISPRTVETHRANMLEKIGAASCAQAIRIAVETEFATA